MTKENAEIDLIEGYLGELLVLLIDVSNKSLQLWFGGKFDARKQLLSLFPSHVLGLGIVTAHEMQLPKEEAVAFLALAQSIYMYQKMGRIALFLSGKKRSELVPYKLIIDFVGDPSSAKKDLYNKFFENFMAKAMSKNGDPVVDAVISIIEKVF